MSNNKQTMKLYTEADLKKVISIYSEEYKTSTDEILKELNLTPIELQSDDEIKQEAERLYPLTGHVSIDHRNHLRKKGFIDGMEWMRDKIKGGNK